MNKAPFISASASLDGALLRALRSFAALLPAALILLHVFSPAAIAAQGAADTPEDAAEIASASALTAGEWEKAAVLIPRLFEKEARLKERFVPALAWAFFKTGRNDEALKLLEGRSDVASLLLKGIITSKEAAVPGVKEPIKTAQPFFVEVSDASEAQGVSLGVFPKRAERAALKKAFYSLVPEPSAQQVEAFESKIAPNASLYFLAGDLLFEGAGRTVSIAFIDTGRLADEIGLQKKAKAITIGVVTRKGGDDRRKALLKELAASGFTAEDMGRGDYYALGDKKKLAGIVMEINEEARLVPLAIKSGFKHIEGDITFVFYNASTDETLTELKEHSSIVHSDEDSGKEMAVAKGYEGAGKRLKDTLAELSMKV